MGDYFALVAKARIVKDTDNDPAEWFEVVVSGPDMAAACDEYANDEECDSPQCELRLRFIITDDTYEGMERNVLRELRRELREHDELI